MATKNTKVKLNSTFFSGVDSEGVLDGSDIIIDLINGQSVGDPDISKVTFTIKGNNGNYTNKGKIVDNQLLINLTDVADENSITLKIIYNSGEEVQEFAIRFPSVTSNDEHDEQTGGDDQENVAQPNEGAQYSGDDAAILNPYIVSATPIDVIKPGDEIQIKLDDEPFDVSLAGYQVTTQPEVDIIDHVILKDDAYFIKTKGGIGYAVTLTFNVLYKGVVQRTFTFIQTVEDEVPANTRATRYQNPALDKTDLSAPVNNMYIILEKYTNNMTPRARFDVKVQQTEQRNMLGIFNMIFNSSTEYTTKLECLKALLGYVDYIKHTKSDNWMEPIYILRQWNMMPRATDLEKRMFAEVMTLVDRFSDPKTRADTLLMYRTERLLDTLPQSMHSVAIRLLQDIVK